MNTNNPLKENVICVLNPDGIKFLDTFKSSKVPVKQLVTPQQAYELQKQDLFRDQIQENTIYIFHPLYNQFIIRKKEDDDKLIQRRINAIETIVSYLGGKNFKILSTHACLKKEKSDVKADVECNAKDLSTKVDVDNKFAFKKDDYAKSDIEISGNAQWKGKYSEAGFNEALRIATENGIENDPVIAFLLEQRNPKHPNPIRRKKYHVKLYSELSQYLEVANKLQTNVSDAMTMTDIKAKIDVDVKKSTEEECSETLDFEVDFGPAINKIAILISIIAALIVAVILLVLFL